MPPGTDSGIGVLNSVNCPVDGSKRAIWLLRYCSTQSLPFRSKWLSQTPLTGNDDGSGPYSMIGDPAATTPDEGMSVANMTATTAVATPIRRQNVRRVLGVEATTDPTCLRFDGGNQEATKRYIRII